jgi:hypothetical protein
MAYMVQFLPSKHEAFSSTPSAIKTQRKTKKKQAGRWWLTPVILAPQKAEIRRIEVLTQPRQTIHESLSPKKHHKI